MISAEHYNPLLRSYDVGLPQQPPSVYLGHKVPLINRSQKYIDRTDDLARQWGAMSNIRHGIAEPWRHKWHFSSLKTEHHSLAKGGGQG
jgi:hypothetical protein